MYIHTSQTYKGAMLLDQLICASKLKFGLNSDDDDYEDNDVDDDDDDYDNNDGDDDDED